MIWKESNFLLNYVLNSVTCAFTDTGTTSTAQVRLVCARQELKITSIFSCTARGSLCNADLSFSWLSNSADVDIMRLSSNELTNVLLYAHPEFTVLMNRTIIEATLKYIKSTGRFKRN